MGVGVGIYGLRRTFAIYLRTAQMSAPARKVVEGLGVAGYVTRGVVFCVAGAFLIYAAVSFDPQKAQGPDGSLRKTGATSLGPGLLFVIALGLVIFELYSRARRGGAWSSPASASASHSSTGREQPCRHVVAGKACPRPGRVAGLLTILTDRLGTGRWRLSLG